MYGSLAFPKACKLYWEDKNRSFGRVFAIECSGLVLCSDEEGERQGRALQVLLGRWSRLGFATRERAGMSSVIMLGRWKPLEYQAFAVTTDLAGLTVDRVLAMQEGDGLTPTSRTTV